MCAIPFRRLMSISLLVALLGLASSAIADKPPTPHPLAVHMNQWLAGSREWATPNPDHDAQNPQGFAEFRVRWDWGPFDQQLLGKLFGVRADGTTVLFWNMYTTLNPGSRTVVFQQIGRNGAYIQGESSLRTEPLAYGEIERLDTAMSTVDGQTRVTRHENTFSADGSHSANVFEQGEDGHWTLTRQWHLVPEGEVLGTGL